MKRLPALCLAAFAAIWAGHGPAAAEGPRDVVARVGSADITAGEVQALLDTLPPPQRASLARDPALLSQTLRQLLASRLLYSEALGKKWDQKPEVAAAIEQARQTVVIDSYLRTVAEPPSSYPGAADLAAAYEANKTSFLVPRQYRLAQIYLAVPAGADKTAEETARRRLATVQGQLNAKGSDFLAVRAEASDAADQGAPGWAREDVIRPEIRAAVAGLAKDGVSELIRLDDGWHIVKLIDTRAAYTRPLDEVRPELVNALRRERAAANAQAYMARLLQANPPAVNELALSRLLAPPAP